MCRQCMWLLMGSTWRKITTIVLTPASRRWRGADARYGVENFTKKKKASASMLMRVGLEP